MKRASRSDTFRDLEAHWNEKLRTAKSKEYPNGFYDIEDVSDPERPLKELHSQHFRKPSVLRRMEARERYNKRIDDFINHSNFTQICSSITSHGNSSLTPAIVRKILEFHRNGLPERDIARKIRRGKKAVHLTLSKAREWMKVA